MKKKIVALGLLLILVVAAFFIVDERNTILPGNFSFVKAQSVDMGVYSNAQASSVLSDINWGNVSLGVATTTIFYVKNLGDDAYVIGPPESSSLVCDDNSGTLLTGDYSPCFTLTLNCSGTQLNPGEVVAAQLSLTIGYDINPNVTYFSFDISLTISTLQLSAGWNQVSFSIIPANPDFSNILSGISGYQAVTWNGTSYVTATSVDAGRAYWILVLSAQTINMLGAVSNTCTLALNPGWNMIGGVFGQSLSASSVFTSGGYYQLDTWTGTGYQTTTTINDGQGYWVFVLTATDITLQ